MGDATEARIVEDRTGDGSEDRLEMAGVMREQENLYMGKHGRVDILMWTETKFGDILSVVPE